MNEVLWEGIPRREVPWYPTINYDLCLDCQDCVNTCPADVYDWDDSEGRPIVARPYNCVVYCQGCAKSCPEEAITFPDKEQVVELVRQLRSRYSV